MTERKDDAFFEGVGDALVVKCKPTLKEVGPVTTLGQFRLSQIGELDNCIVEASDEGTGRVVAGLA